MCKRNMIRILKNWANEESLRQITLHYERRIPNLLYHLTHSPPRLKMSERSELNCPKCGSEDIVMWLREPTLHCMSCGHDYPDPWKGRREVNI